MPYIYLARVHALNGEASRECLAVNAMATLAAMLGYAAANLRANPIGWVSLWTYSDNGTIVGRIEARDFAPVVAS